MRLLQLIAILLFVLLLLIACTESRVYISVGEDARAGRAQKVDSIIATEIETDIETDITGYKKKVGQ